MDFVGRILDEAEKAYSSMEEWEAYIWSLLEMMSLKSA